MTYGRKGRGVTWLAVLLIASPLLFWAYLSALAYLTILEPPYTGSRGLPLALQVAFAPGNIVVVALGIGILLRSAWTRRIALAVFAVALAVALWQVGIQVATSRYDANVLVAGASFLLSAVALWTLSRASVGAEFRADADTRGPMAPTGYPKSLVTAAWIECAVALAAALVVARLWFVTRTTTLLDVGGGIGVTEADELLRMFVFVVVALLLSPHLLAACASLLMILGRNTAHIARRYALIALCATVVCLLFTAWLATRADFAFHPGSVTLLYAFCAISLAWHAAFLYLIARDR